MTTTRPPTRRGRGHGPDREAGGDLSAEELGTFLARELHDGVAQTLAVMLLELETFRRDQHGRDGALKQIDALERQTRGALADLRALLIELRARQRREQDLVLLLRGAMVERQERNQSIQFRLHVMPEWPERIDSGAATHLLRIAVEAIDNAVHHGTPESIEVSLAVEAESAVMTIRDDGSGIKDGQETALRPGFGIIGMSERAQLIGGTVEVLAGAQGRGTRVQVIVPLAKFREVDRTA
ncbi:MAG TPA: histidine kinase [Candidatus Dormibacteraeota bacterium]|nr:histidine kinase [Candidatus Dormibacteraeota bacterium]